ncbi:MAG: alpha/beta hydrolase [Anaerolineaceae bacterium]|nr:alpha/beta hydrolase [Anaerolineaceae bacterium]
MHVTESVWQTPDGIHLHVRHWRPANTPKGSIILVHGLGEHCGRYEHVAEFFTAAKFAVTGFDLRGHGESGGVRGHAPAYEALAEDIQHFVEEANQNYNGLPLFLYGHSLGGALTLYHVLTGRRQITAAIAGAPGLVPAMPVPAAKMTAARVLARFIPSFTMSNDLDTSGLSRDPSVVERYHQDPLVHDRVSARLGVELVDNGRWMLNQIKVNTPLLILQGTADRLVNPTAAPQLAGNLQGDVTYKGWDGVYHELHNEPEKGDVLRFVLSWLESKAGGRSRQVTPLA